MSFNVERENRKRAEYLGDFDAATSEIGSRSLFDACSLSIETTAGAFRLSAFAEDKSGPARPSDRGEAATNTGNATCGVGTMG